MRFESRFGCQPEGRGIDGCVEERFLADGEADRGEDVPEGKPLNDGAVDVLGEILEDLGKVFGILAVSEGAVDESRESLQVTCVSQVGEVAIDLVCGFVDVLDGKDRVVEAGEVGRSDEGSQEGQVGWDERTDCLAWLDDLELRAFRQEVVVALDDLDKGIQGFVEGVLVSRLFEVGAEFAGDHRPVDLVSATVLERCEMECRDVRVSYDWDVS